MAAPAIISASRRTDIPAFYLDWLVNGIRKGEVLVKGPYGRFYRVIMAPERVHTLVLWSKNFGPLLKNEGARKAIDIYSQVYFLFTITGLGGSFWERGVPPSHKAMAQLKPLADWWGPERIGLRFDPVVYWREGGKLKTNLFFFEKLAPELERLSIKRVIFSFVTWYPKSIRRTKSAGLDFYDPSPDEKRKAGEYLASVASAHGLSLEACAQPEEILVSGIKKGSCINAELLSRLHPGGWKLELPKDRGQRELCGCSRSIDIGSYALPCRAFCLYCYANPRLRIY